MRTQDVLDSKIKKVRIELPHYNFSHSSSGDSSHSFIGRVRLQKKLIKLVENATDKTGVYLVTGNRGVGKTSLVSEVIKATSLKIKSEFTNNFRYLLFLFFAVAGTQFCLQAFDIYGEQTIILRIVSLSIFILSFILLCYSNGYSHKLFKQKIGLKIWDSFNFTIKELSYLINPNGKTQYVLKIISIVSFMQPISTIFCITPTVALIGYLFIVLVFTLFRFGKRKSYEYKQKRKEEKLSKGFIFYIIDKLLLTPILNFIKNHSRLYLRINFGHKLKDEKDILRLITRTLSTEYKRYRNSFWRMLPWRVIAFVFLFTSAFLFSPIVKNIVDKGNLGVIFSKDRKVNTIMVETTEETKVETMVETKENTTINAKINNFLNVLDQLLSETSNIVFNIPKYFLKGRDADINNTESEKFVFPKNYYFWFSFFAVYLLCVLLFRSTWITNFFITHRIIMRRLIKLNSDITHSTERENSISVNSGNIGPELGARKTKSRNVADAREIEKELQDILDDIQRIPVIMCRPNIVIVLDELDKVEPSDVNTEKEIRQTKATLLSISATRERQTEILKILSNMKYFLSTASVKFIFIAGREMYDIHLADVSERNNYIGSIFNAVIYVPSFLTDHPSGIRSVPEESSIASLTEEFVCRRLFPCDYQVESYDLKNYKNYLERIILSEVAQDKKRKEKIEEKIEKAIEEIKTNKKKLIYERIIVQDNEIKQIEKIITNQNKKIKLKIKKEIFIEQDQDIRQQIKKIAYSIQKKEKEQINKIFTGNKEKTEQIEQIEQILTEQNKEIAQKIQKIIEDIKPEEIQKIIAVLQQFIIYLAHVSKGAPKKMMQLFESFVEIRDEKGKNRIGRPLSIYRYQNSKYFLTFNYYKQYTLGIIAYLITPIFYRLAESNIKEHSDKLLVSSLRFVDFMFKFHKHSFSWKHLDMSPEMLEVNHAPELKSVAVDLLNYLTQVHINKSNFSLSDYKFDSWIANEIFAMTKTDEVFSALFSFSLDEMLPLKKHYQDLLENTKKEYQNDKYSTLYIDAISSLQVVLGDLCYYNDELEEAEVYYKNAVQALRKLGQKNGDNEKKEDIKMNHEHFYIYVRNMLRLGIIYEKRKQYDFAYITYGELCEWIIRELNITKYESLPLNVLSNNYDVFFKKMTYEGLKILYLPFIAKLQILEQSHMGGITCNHLDLLKKEFQLVTFNIEHKEARLIETEFYSRVADILYYKNSDLKDFKCKKDKKNSSCTACYYYYKALYTLLNKSDESTVIELLRESVEQINGNYNMKFCTILARIFSDWGNVFFSCDTKNREDGDGCYIWDKKDCNTILKEPLDNILYICIKYIESEDENEESFSSKINQLKTKRDIAFVMYSVSLVAYRKASLYKRSAYQIYKTLCLFKYYEIYNEDYIKQLSRQAIHYLWYANDDLNMLELNKRKKDFDKRTIEEMIPLKNLLVDSEITKIRILVKELKLKYNLSSKTLEDCYNFRITSPCRINYSIGARIYRLGLKSKVNYEAYQQLLKESGIQKDTRKIDYTLEYEDYNKLKTGSSNEIAKNIFGKFFDIKEGKINIIENLIADTIYCLIDVVQLSETMDETYVFTHSFLASIHKYLSFWIRQYEKYETYKEDDSQIEKLLEEYLGEEWREQLSGYRENQRALSHYYKCLEMHKEGRAYHNMIDIMCYVKDDFNDRSDHFNIAEERHLIVNEKIDEKINELKDIYKDSKLYDVDNYFNKF